ncbi:MAG TPA: Rossmann fold nucleotide-binding protein [Propionibacteriaceae bacterium]|nr:Rossmann fold nucleotide-binding protein [Propionibacteriaceae bacterium]
MTQTVGSVEVESLEQFDRLRSRSKVMAGWFIQDLDLRDRSDALLSAEPRGAIFLGCRLELRVEDSLRDRGALVFPELEGLPFDPYRVRLYTAADLYGPVTEGGPYASSPDAQSNAWRLKQGTPPDVSATLAMSLHDHSISDALTDTMRRMDRGQVVGVMGGHGVARGSAAYEDAARLGLAVTQAGMTVLTGGGPGAMEAVNLGARLASAPGDLDDVLAMLARVPGYAPSVDEWARLALDVCERYPEGGGYGIPTWFYGHEPPNVFPGAIAKYFSNALREDSLLQLCGGGVLYLPGAAGTVQEVFQAATPAFYAPDGVRIPPLVLVGRDYWTRTLPAWPLLRALAEGRGMAAAVYCVDTWSDALSVLA